VPVDPTPFLATVVGTSVTLAAIVGGLLVARFVTIDSDQQTSRKVLTDARERLDAARGRASAAWQAVLDWDADEFFWKGRIAKAVADGLTTPQHLMRIADWDHSEDDLWPYVEQAAKEHQAAREILPSLVTQLGEEWDDFRRRNTGLPPIRWPRIWEHVYDEVMRVRVAEEAAREAAARKAVRARSPLAFSFDFDSISAGIGGLPLGTRALLSHATTTDERSTAARRRDGLITDHRVAKQQVEDYEGELRRLQEAHAEIVRPDARLWWGVGIVVLLAAVGVALPLWIMAQGPKDLASVRWLFWVFAGALAALLAYIVAYLVQLTRAKSSQ
jgi:hypothetical protein